MVIFLVRLIGDSQRRGFGLEVILSLSQDRVFVVFAMLNQVQHDGFASLGATLAKTYMI
jgi:hypothetical protein